MLMSAADYRESLRRVRPRVFVDGRAVDSVADEPALAPGIAAVGVTYDFARDDAHKALMTARQGTSGKTVNRMLHIDLLRDAGVDMSKRAPIDTALNHFAKMVDELDELIY